MYLCNLIIMPKFLLLMLVYNYTIKSVPHNLCNQQLWYLKSRIGGNYSFSIVKHCNYFHLSSHSWLSNWLL